MIQDIYKLQILGCQTNVKKLFIINNRYDVGATLPS